jgi:hypothetical protein
VVPKNPNIRTNVDKSKLAEQIAQEVVNYAVKHELDFVKYVPRYKLLASTTRWAKEMLENGFRNKFTSRTHVKLELDYYMLIWSFVEPVRSSKLWTVLE